MRKTLQRHWRSSIIRITLKAKQEGFKSKGGPCIFEEWNAIESTQILQGVVWGGWLLSYIKLPHASTHPFILEENSTISKELMGKDVSIIFDGTTRDGEVLVLLLCFVDEWELKVRLVRFQLVKRSVCGDDLAWIMIEVLHCKLGVLQGQLLAAMRDRASVNTCALRTVSVLYPDMLDVGCIFLTESEWNAKHQPLLHLYLNGMLFSPQPWRPDECGARYLVEECPAITQPGGGLCGSVWRSFLRSGTTYTPSCKATRPWQKYRGGNSQI